ncbi:MFS transporter [Streptomyces mutomycini]|uniref:MFS transporter n=1 Tax=Streptomyces mutomycini TaxID=284036 RepID=A0ABW0AX43_9ACTN|nr:MFS transporter [Streptomyces mutomycini]
MSDTLITVDPRRRRRAFLGAVTGHLIEWYDYGVYGFVAIYIGQLFFPADNEASQLMSSFAVFALSFFIRPLGGLFFGPMADRIGRKQTLLVVMLLMFTSTFAIGLLPTHAAIGITAPLLLVLTRCLQGFSAGGEIGTTTAFIAEYAGPGRRGYSTSWLMVTAVLGLLLGGVVANGLIVLLGDEAMLAWGWRIPFLVAGPLGLVALYIRLKLEDSPEFQALAERGEKSEAPIRDAWPWKRAIALIFCIITLHASFFYLVVTYASTYMSTELGFSNNAKFLLVTIAMAVTAAVMPFGGMFTDRFGRKYFLLVVGLASTGAVIWLFEAAPGATPASFAAPLLTVAICLGLYASSTYGTMCDLFPTRVRSTGISLAYNVPVALFGGSAPLISAWLIGRTGDIASPWYFYVATCVLSLVALVVLKQSDFDRANQHSATPPVPRTDAAPSNTGPVGEVTA